MTYIFNPEDHGFEPVRNFPELAQRIYEDNFVKVTTIADARAGRAVYWFVYCRRFDNNIDGRWNFESSSFCEMEKPEEAMSHTTYNGLISSHEFAELLLANMFGTLHNSGVADYGIDRLKQNINSQRLVHSIKNQ